MSAAPSLVVAPPARPVGLRRTLRRFQLDPLTLAAVAVMLGAVVVAIFADALAPFDATRQFVRYHLVAPGTPGPDGSTFYLGTDELGRDFLSRLIVGARSSLGIAFAAVALGTVLGSLIAIVSGYFQGWVDLIVQRAMDSMMSIPVLLLAMVLTGVLGASLTNLMIAIGVTQIPITNRIVRAAVLTVREQLYITAAIAVGAPTGIILRRYILPNVFAPIIVVASTRLGQAIVIEGSLSFLGLGAPPPFPDWGAMVFSGRDYLLQAPELVVYPSLVITVVVLAFNLAGDALRDALDPKLRSR
jgi:peptide/nickel transport system permease protein